jgi:geranylgeranyl diphosphate synthase, type I
MRPHDPMANSPHSERLRACESLMLDALCRRGADRLNHLIRYHLESGGNRIRARLALETGHALHLSRESCIALAASCELVHNASLLHDDIQDRSTHRRGKPAAWHCFDANTAMCAGTLMLSAAFDVLARIDPNPAKLIRHLHQRTADLIVGQIADLQYEAQRWGVEQYLQIVMGKSGALLALPLELAMIAADRGHALQTATQTGEAFAIAYQIADDMADLYEDLAIGNCNIIAVIQAQDTNVSAQQARQQARLLAQTHLNQACEYARQLPEQSGQAFITLCHTLTLSVCTESSSSCEKS